MPTLIVTCRRCGRTFEPDPRDVRAGAWRVCPACREAGEGIPPAGAGAP